MSKKIERINTGGNDICSSPILNITETSSMMIKKLQDILDELIKRVDLFPSDDEFYYKYLSFLNLYDILQKEVIAESGISIVCRPGCTNCCCHWVDDVSSFEACIISRYLNDNHPNIIDSVITSFKKDAVVLSNLRDIVNKKTDKFLSQSDEIDDNYELLLSCFYQMERPCALLDEKGSCRIYPVRPLTCRDYINVRDRKACLPDYINEVEPATLILYLSDTVSQLLEILHSRFDDGSNNTSFRSLLVYFLETGK